MCKGGQWGCRGRRQGPSPAGCRPMALKFWQKQHLAPLSPDRGEGSGVRGETRLPRAARTVQKDAGFTVSSKCWRGDWQCSLTPHPRPLSHRRGEGGLWAIFARIERTSTPLGCRHAAGIVGNCLQRGPAFGGSAGASASRVFAYLCTGFQRTSGPLRISR